MHEKYSQEKKRVTGAQILWKLTTWSPIKLISTKHKKALKDLEKLQTSRNSAKNVSPDKAREKMRVRSSFILCLGNIKSLGLTWTTAEWKGSQRRNYSSGHKLASTKQEGKFFSNSLCVSFWGQREIGYAPIYPAPATAGGRMSATKGQ